MATKSDERKAHAKRSSPGYAVSRYASDPKTHAPVVKKTTERRLKKYEELAKTVKKVGTTFGIRKNDIMVAIDSGNIDQAVLTFQRQAYATIVNLIPKAEAAYLREGREHQAYVLNALLSQGRELAADLMASGDRQQLADVLVNEVLAPTFKSIVQQLMLETIQTKAVLSDKIKPEYVSTVSMELDQSLKRLAGVLTDMYRTTADQTRKKLVGE